MSRNHKGCGAEEGGADALAALGMAGPASGSWQGLGAQLGRQHLPVELHFSTQHILRTSTCTRLLEPGILLN